LPGRRASAASAQSAQERLEAAAHLGDCPSGRVNGDQAAIRQAVATQTRAIATGDKAAYLATFAPVDAEFSLERSRWFDYRLAAELADLRVTVEALERRDADTWAVKIWQRYLIGADRSAREVRFTRLYRRQVDGAWLAADLAFSTLETDHFQLRHAAAADRAALQRVAAAAEAAWSLVHDGYGAAPADKTAVKLYTDRELLRQDSKITIGRLFNGWGEPGESIKLWLRPDPDWSARSALAHELVHKVSLAESANLCSWFAEGLANHYGSFPGFGGSYLGTGRHQPADYDKPLAWLEAFDPDAVDNDADWWVYGGMAAAVVRFMAESYGPDAPRRLVQALAAWPQERAGYVWSIHDATLRGYLDLALRQALGLDMAGLDAAWRRWIKALD